jgi:hypothetical protein
MWQVMKQFEDWLMNTKIVPVYILTFDAGVLALRMSSEKLRYAQILAQAYNGYKSLLLEIPDILIYVVLILIKMRLSV